MLRKLLGSNAENVHTIANLYAQNPAISRILWGWDRWQIFWCVCVFFCTSNTMSLWDSFFPLFYDGWIVLELLEIIYMLVTIQKLPSSFVCTLEWIVHKSKWIPFVLWRKGEREVCHKLQKSKYYWSATRIGVAFCPDYVCARPEKCFLRRSTIS